MERDEDEIHERDERVRFDSVLTMDEEREAMLFEVNESMLLADGLEDALIGYVRGPSINLWHSTIRGRLSRWLRKKACHTWKPLNILRKIF